MNDPMRKISFLFLCQFFSVTLFSGYAISSPGLPEPYIIDHDTIGKQVLYNGRVWRNLYGRVLGDQYLFTKEFLTGDVTIEGKVFHDLKLKYDIFNDELISYTDKGIILQLNKERIDEFSLNFGNRNYQFRRIDPDSVNNVSGFLELLYKGNTSLFVRHRKEILLLYVDNKFDSFSQTDKILLKKDGKFYMVRNRIDFMRLIKDHKKQVKSFIRTNKLKITKKDPWSFRPVVEYYDKLQH